MPNPVPFEFIPEDIRKEIVNQCQSQGCQDAKNELVRIRNDILATCTQLDTAKSQRDVYGAVAAALWASAAGAAVAAATTPCPLCIVFWVTCNTRNHLQYIGSESTEPCRWLIDSHQQQTVRLAVRCSNDEWRVSRAV
jgi:hypothetical protein